MTTGSIGAGIVISEGVTATVRHADSPTVTIRQRAGDGSTATISHESPPLSAIMERLGVTASITTDCHLPIGAGFGLSAAALLAAATALNRLFALGLTPRDIAGYSHQIEVEHRTGLGDVAAAQGSRNPPLICEQGQVRTPALCHRLLSCSIDIWRPLRHLRHFPQ